ncbi:unnamed protein product [Closterium sp. Naga37s-1]|nr:unnamed protein product [Closterium sp. Naga37s-1]
MRPPLQHHDLLCRFALFCRLNFCRHAFLCSRSSFPLLRSTSAAVQGSALSFAISASVEFCVPAELDDPLQDYTRCC